MGRAEAHTPECMAAWLDADSPCFCGALSYPQAPKLVDNFVGGSQGNQPPATPTDAGGFQTLDGLGHDGPSAPDGPQQHGLARHAVRAIGPSDGGNGGQLALGDLATCRTCHGTGQVRAKADPRALRARANQRRKGMDVPDLPTMEPCGECGGRGVLPPSKADSDDPARARRRKLRADQLDAGL